MGKPKADPTRVSELFLWHFGLCHPKLVIKPFDGGRAFPFWFGKEGLLDEFEKLEKKKEKLEADAQKKVDKAAETKKALARAMEKKKKEMGGHVAALGGSDAAKVKHCTVPLKTHCTKGAAPHPARSPPPVPSICPLSPVPPPPHTHHCGAPRSSNGVSPLHKSAK